MSNYLQMSSAPRWGLSAHRGKYFRGNDPCRAPVERDVGVSRLKLKTACQNAYRFSKVNTHTRSIIVKSSTASFFGGNTQYMEPNWLNNLLGCNLEKYFIIPILGFKMFFEANVLEILTRNLHLFTIFSFLFGGLPGLWLAYIWLVRPYSFHFTLF